MSDKIFVKPTEPVKPKDRKLPTPPQVKVRNPERGRHLLPEGEWVVKNAYWHRRMNDGDVVITDPPKKPVTKKTEKES